MIQIGKNYWDLEICRKSYKNKFPTSGLAGVVKANSPQAARRSREWRNLFLPQLLSHEWRNFSTDIAFPYTPARTLSISGLKSRVLKLTLLN
jgi:hypothetical protein